MKDGSCCKSYLVNGIMDREVIRGINDLHITPDRHLSQANGEDLPTRIISFAFK